MLRLIVYLLSVPTNAFLVYEIMIRVYIHISSMSSSRCPFLFFRNHALQHTRFYCTKLDQHKIDQILLCYYKDTYVLSLLTFPLYIQITRLFLYIKETYSTQLAFQFLSNVSEPIEFPVIIEIKSQSLKIISSC